MWFQDGRRAARRAGDVREASFALTTRAPRSARRWFSWSGLAAPVIRDRVALLLSELVANSVAHSGLSAPASVDVRVTSIPGGLRVDVTDDGVGLGPAAAEAEDAYGLRLVDQASDRWGHTDDPTNVWFEVTA
jgi:anti-sigma regulatory factor (Ser/Thr protein kinase)